MFQRQRNGGELSHQGEEVQQLQIDQKDAARFITAYFERYRGVKEYLDRSLEEDGVPTLGSNRVSCAHESSRNPVKPRYCGDAIAAQGIPPVGAQPP